MMLRTVTQADVEAMENTTAEIDRALLAVSDLIARCKRMGDVERAANLRSASWALQRAKDYVEREWR